MSIYDTTVMIKTVRKIYPVVTFFRNRYFPTGADDIFPTNQVLVEYKEGKKKLAPFVIPRKGGITVDREGYSAETFEPPYIAPQRALTIDDLNKKGFGESLYSTKTPQERQAEILGQDLADLTESIDRREEWMCRELLTTGEVIMKHYADKYGVGTPVEKVLRFYNGTFDNEYTPTADWSEKTADIYSDLDAMVAKMKKAGCPCTDLVMAADVWAHFIQNETIQKLSDKNILNLATFEPVETPDGVSHMGTINVRGKKLDIFVYDEEFENEDGTMEEFLPSGSVLLTAPAMGRMLYGAISQIEQADQQFHTYAEKRVPKYLADASSEVREIRVSAAPVPVPNDRKGWVFSQVVSN